MKPWPMALLLTTCVPQERPVAFQDVKEPFVLAPADRPPPPPKKVCHKQWGMLTTGYLLEARAIGCEHEYMSMKDCFDFYCDSNKCQAEFDEYYDCEIEYYRKVRNAQGVP